jgi:hypothetical protein
MPAKSARVPSYCRHKASGQAVVRLDGRDHYLGPYGTDESHERYALIIARWQAAGTTSRPAGELASRLPATALSVGTGSINFVNTGTLHVVQSGTFNANGR